MDTAYPGRRKPRLPPMMSSAGTPSRRPPTLLVSEPPFILKVVASPTRGRYWLATESLAVMGLPPPRSVLLVSRGLKRYEPDPYVTNRPSFRNPNPSTLKPKPPSPGWMDWSTGATLVVMVPFVN